MKNFIELVGGLNTALGIDAATDLLSPMLWIDDGRQDLTIGLQFEGGDDLTMEITKP